MSCPGHVLISCHVPSMLMLFYKQKNQHYTSFYYLIRMKTCYYWGRQLSSIRGQPFSFISPLCMLPLNSSHMIPPSPGHLLSLFSSVTWQKTFCFLLAGVLQEQYSPVFLHSAACGGSSTQSWCGTGCLNLLRVTAATLHLSCPFIHLPAKPAKINCSWALTLIGLKLEYARKHISNIKQTF